MLLFFAQKEGRMKPVITDDMSLEDKLKAIDDAMKQAQTDFNKKNGRQPDAPVDPADLTMCEGCQ